MAPVPTPDYLARFSEALVSEIKSEMGRRDLSFRGLAALLGENPQYVSSRLGGGNPRTGKRVEINVADLFAIASAMDLDARDLFARAQLAAGDPESTNPAANLSTLAEKRAEKRTYPKPAQRAARKATGKPKMGDE